MKKKILFVILLSVLACSLFVFSSCGKEKTNETGEKSDVKPDWSVSFEQEKDVFDINDVELTFYIEEEVITEDVFREFDPEIDMSSLPYEEGTEEYEQAYQAFYAEELRQYERDTAICPEYADLYFTSFGNEFPIKRLSKEEIKEETTGQPFWKHEEKIKLPEEVFINEYGAVCFRVNIISKSSSSVDASENRGGISRQVFYHKTGNTVEISREDLGPEYVYNPEHSSKATRGFRVGEAWQDYCAFLSSTSREIDDENDFEIDFYFGRIYGENEKNVPSVDIYIITKNASGEEEKTFVRTVNDYMSDEYKCERVYDYYANIIEIKYNHSEKLRIPKDFFVGDSGEIGIGIFAHENQEKLGSTIIKYDADKTFHIAYHIH